MNEDRSNIEPSVNNGDSYDVFVSHIEAIGGPPPGGESIVFGGIHMERYIIKAGTVLISHCHSYDHPSILASGSGDLWTPDGIQYLRGPTEVMIAAGIKHAFAARTDVVWYCIHQEGKVQFEGGV